MNIWPVLIVWVPPSVQIISLLIHLYSHFLHLCYLLFFTRYFKIIRFPSSTRCVHVFVVMPSSCRCVLFDFGLRMNHLSCFTLFYCLVFSYSDASRRLGQALIWLPRWRRALLLLVWHRATLRTHVYNRRRDWLLREPHQQHLLLHKERPQPR